ncbi:hypothetical protein [Neobacillus kokaensis]|uniref:Transposase n=1 Tax=Neobacillus kokaensis TaxID=2759023 RepID=A0ABQ3MWJ2_9BACI|nr:hypothetical protein [Neobacillus kokaensis]GHH96609.1 hypothetical protein AM1BK_01520 [Neobacillus kokaensis]
MSKYKNAKTYERVIKRSNILGLQTTVMFSDGTKEVTEDFTKSSWKRLRQLGFNPVPNNKRGRK